MTPPPPKGKNPVSGDGDASDEEVRRQESSDGISDLLEVRAEEPRRDAPVDMTSFDSQFVTEPALSPEAPNFDGLPEDGHAKTVIKSEPRLSPDTTRPGETVADFKSDDEDLIDLRTVPLSEGHGSTQETKQHVSESETSIKTETSGNKSPKNQNQAQSTVQPSSTRSPAEGNNDLEADNSSSADDEPPKDTEDPSRRVHAMMVDKVMSSFMDWLDVRLKVKKKKEPAMTRPPGGAPQPRHPQMGMPSQPYKTHNSLSGAFGAGPSGLGAAFPPPPAAAPLASNRLGGFSFGSAPKPKQAQQPALQGPYPLSPQHDYHQLPQPQRPRAQSRGGSHYTGSAAEASPWSPRARQTNSRARTRFEYQEEAHPRPAAEAEELTTGVESAPSPWAASSPWVGPWDSFEAPAAPPPVLSAPPPPPLPPASPVVPQRAQRPAPSNALPKRGRPLKESISPPQTETSTPGLGDAEHEEPLSQSSNQPSPQLTAKSGFLSNFLEARKQKEKKAAIESLTAKLNAAAPSMKSGRKVAAAVPPSAAPVVGAATSSLASSSSATMAMGQQAPSTQRAPMAAVGFHPDPFAAKGRAHRRQEEDEDGAEDGDGNRPPRSKMPRVQQDEISGAKLACPFFKHNPRKYKNQRPCCGPGWDHVHRIKEHIYRKHSLPKFSCPRCNQPSETQSALQAHARSPDPCEVREPEVLDGITQDQEKKLRSRKKTAAKELTEAEKWTQVYKILFPDVREREIPSPYYTTEDAQTTLGGYEDYLRRELPPLVRRQLEKEVERELSFVEEGMKHKVIEIARNLQLALFRGYQQLEHQERGAGSSEGPSPDDASTSEAGASSSSAFDTSPSTMTTQGTTPEVPDPLDIFTNDPSIPDFDFDFLSEVPYPETQGLSKDLDLSFGFPGAYDAQAPPAFQPGMEAFGGPQVGMPSYGMEGYDDGQGKAIDTRLLSYAP